MLIAGDVGGTKARIGLFERRNAKLELVVSERYVSREFDNLETIVKLFLEQHSGEASGPLEAACFGLPGPVIAGRVKVTNLPWEVVALDLVAALNIPKVKLVNDLVSTAAAIPTFGAESLVPVYAGKGTPQTPGTCAVVAPGTGLGHALIHRDEESTTFLASEGGHANFAPMSETEIDLWRYLHAKFGQVSVERVLCGPGLVNIYSFLRDSGRAEEPVELAARFTEEDAAGVVASAALAGTHNIAVVALDMFCRILGAHSSNILLTSLATGGVYLGGGIPPKIVPALLKGPFLEGYLDKNKCREQVQSTPVFIIKDDYASLYGAAAIAGAL
jgi:glucokinase